MADDKTTRTRDLEASTDKWRWAGLILMGLFFLAFPLFRFYEPAQRADAREAQVSFLAAQGSELFQGSCESCHGVGGDGAIAPAIGSKDFLESVDDRQITQLTASGVPGTEMVAYSNDLGGPMTSQEITAITTYLRSLEEDAEAMANWRTPLEDEDLTGQELFLLACSRCHGVDLGGKEDVAPDISVTSFTQMEDDEFIIGRITDGYKNMPRFGRILTDDQIASIVGYMRFGTNPPPTTTTTTTAPTTGDSTTTTSGAAPDPSNDEELAIGRMIWEETAGGQGCVACHGPDATGTIDGPGITGASRSAFRGALGGGVPDMAELKLTPDEVNAVFAYLRWLVTQP